MKVALLQMPIVWENAQANRDYIDQKIIDCAAHIDLFVLPEMFTTGFSMQPEHICESMNGATVQWMQRLALAKNSAVAGSIIIKENNKFFNRLLFVHPTGRMDFYDKRHLFSLAGEHDRYTAGTQKTIVDFRGFRFCLQICYDLRFPVFSRNTENYDVLLYVANWPEPRIAAWDALLKARAIENMSYCLGVNRTGTDANKHEYCGHTQAIDYLGKNILDAQTCVGLFVVEIDKNMIHDTRKKLNFLADQDRFTIL